MTAAAADLVVTAVDTPDQSFSGEAAAIQWTVRNDGAAAWPGTRYWIDRVSITPDPVFDPNRTLAVQNFTVSLEQPLGSGESYTRSGDIPLPRGIDGPFYVHVQTDIGGTVSPVHFPDNHRSRQSFGTHMYEISGNNRGTQPIQVSYREPDLVVSDVGVPAAPPGSGETFSVNWKVTNEGGRATREFVWYDRIYLSLDPSLDEDDQVIGSHRHRAMLEPGQAYTRTEDVTLPEGIQGEFYVLVFTDSNVTGSRPPAEAGVELESNISAPDGPLNLVMGRVPEFGNEGNNIAAVPITVVLAPASDLRVTQLSAPERAVSGQMFDLTYTVTNTGSDTPVKQSAWDDLFYLSRDEFLDLRSDRFLGFHRHSGGLAAGAGYDVSRTLDVPRGLTGSFYVFVVTDPLGSGRPRGDVFEGADELNNATAGAVPMILEQPPPSDLQIEQIVIPSAAQSGDPITVRWTVSNRGDAAAEGTWSDTAYLSKTRSGTSATSRWAGFRLPAHSNRASTESHPARTRPPSTRPCRRPSPGCTASSCAATFSTRFMRRRAKPTTAPPRPIHSASQWIPSSSVSPCRPPSAPGKSACSSSRRTSVRHSGFVYPQTRRRRPTKCSSASPMFPRGSCSMPPPKGR